MINVAVVYQDALTRRWALELCLPVSQRVGEEEFQATWYGVDSLNDPRVFLDAVRSAVTADVIMVAVHAGDDLPLDVYAWIFAWRPRRLFRAGALTALIGVAEPSEALSVRTWISFRMSAGGQSNSSFPASSRIRLKRPCRWVIASTPSLMKHPA